MTITVHALTRTDVERSKHNHETYKMLYERCVQTIRRVHQAGNAELYWTVPAFVFERNLYDVDHAVRYIRDKLRIGGFDVNVLDRTTLNVTWHAKARKAAQKQLHKTIRAEASKRAAAAAPPKKNTAKEWKDSIERLKNSLRHRTAEE